MKEKITIPYDKELGEQHYVEKYKALGYRIHEVQNLTEGDFIIFGPITDYHSVKNDEWVFDKETWLKEIVEPLKNKLLLESNYTMLEDVKEKMNKDKISEWKTYRQELRNLMDNIKYEEKLKLPVKPL